MTFFPATLSRQNLGGALTYGAENLELEREVCNLKVRERGVLHIARYLTGPKPQSLDKHSIQ